ncbi:MAG TPA: WD40 repeat domain-containing protein [Terracidiphilus sp.]|jgi:WD40 repeat protein
MTHPRSKPWLAFCFVLIYLALHFSMAKGQASNGMKLVVDDGRYDEEPFVRQVAVTADDRYVLTSDFSNGVRTFDMASGQLINHLEGHSLPGETRYDPANELFLTSGDRKVKIWDWRRQTLIKTIPQSFHSQYMNGVFIDSRKKYVFAEHAKYVFSTGLSLPGYDRRTPDEKTILNPVRAQYFWGDKYYLFDRKSGQVRVYDCLTETLINSYTVTDYQIGINEYFDYDSGLLFLSYPNGVRIIKISDGSSDYALFDRHPAFFNLGETTCYGISADGEYLIAGSDQGVGLVVLKKIEPGKGFGGNTKEVLRQDLLIGEIHALHHSNKVVYTTGTAIHLLDLDEMRVVWDTEPKLMSLRNIFLAPDDKHLYIALGHEKKVNRHWFERTYGGYKFDTYFDSMDADWGTFKPGLCAGNLPSDLLPFWEDGARMVRLHLDQGTSLETVDDKLPFAPKGTMNSSTDPAEGRIYSPSRRYSIVLVDFGLSKIDDGERNIGQASDPGVIYHVEYSPDERYLAFGGSGRWVTVVDLKTGLKAQRVYGESYITSITFSYDNEYLFTGSLKNEIMMWSLKDGKLIRRFVGSNGSIKDTEITRDGKTLLSVAEDGSLRFWEVATGRLLLTGFVVNAAAVEREIRNNSARATANPNEPCDSTLKALSDPASRVNGSSWVAVAPDGRFDSNNLDETRSLHWVISDDALRALPLEIFMRDYYEPRLLSKVFSGSRLKQVQPLQNLNRELPIATIVRADSPAERSPLSEAAPNSTVSVTVTVQNTQSTIQRDATGTPVQSGAYDLRLFRDDQLVAQWPDVDPEADSRLGTIDSDAKRDAWRQLHQIPLDPSGKATVTFPRIQVPHPGSRSNVEFTAYAFNKDRVKSLTTPPFEYQPSRNAVNARTPRHAYVILMAVNANQSHWNLEVAVPSAERAVSLLHTKLKQRYDNVTEVRLYSDLAPDSPQVVSTKARKKYLQTVLDVLAGRAADPALLREIDPQSQLRPATPDDAVVLYFVSHGYADPRGTFYLVPYDTGVSWGITEDLLNRCITTEDHSDTCKPSYSFLESSIASTDLAAWWRGVDAGEVVMILDSCHSGAAPGTGFRPGPLGDPGLGQLSYDKAMEILVASQPQQTERGTWIGGGEGQTLLEAALETVASANPQSTLAQWMKGTEQELPRIMKRLYPEMAEDTMQLPELLDFSSRRRVSAVITAP